MLSLLERLRNFGDKSTDEAVYTINELVTTEAEKYLLMKYYEGKIDELLNERYSLEFSEFDADNPNEIREIEKALSVYNSKLDLLKRKMVGVDHFILSLNQERN